MVLVPIGKGPGPSMTTGAGGRLYLPGLVSVRRTRVQVILAWQWGHGGKVCPLGIARSAPWQWLER